jgi:hypothetical protein
MQKLKFISTPREELKDYKDYVGSLFLNDIGMYNICETEEEVAKTNKWNINCPLRVIIVSENETIQPGDKFMANCTNQDLDGGLFTYLGPLKDSDGLIDILSESEEKIISTNFLILKNSAFKYLREATNAELQMIVSKQATCDILENV